MLAPALKESRYHKFCHESLVQNGNLSVSYRRVKDSDYSCALIMRDAVVSYKTLDSMTKISELRLAGCHEEFSACLLYPHL
jgi:hypothetical protein